MLTITGRKRLRLCLRPLHPRPACLGFLQFWGPAGSKNCSSSSPPSTRIMEPRLIGREARPPVWTPPSLVAASARVSSFTALLVITIVIILMIIMITITIASKHASKHKPCDV